MKETAGTTYSAQVSTRELCAQGSPADEAALRRLGPLFADYSKRKRPRQRLRLSERISASSGIQTSSINSIILAT